MSRILLISNEKGISAILTKLLKTEGYKIVPATDAAKANELITSSEEYKLIIVTVGKGAEADKAVEAMTACRVQRPSVPVIAITESDGGVTAKRLADAHLFACLEKPLKVDQLISSVQRAVDQGGAPAAGDVNLNLQLEACYQFENIIAESPAMKSVCDMISRVAGTDVTILISGEKGTGKELIARTLQANSRRKDKNLAIVNCSSPEAERDLFSANGLEKANGGTLILQEVDSLQPMAQQALLKCLQEKKIAKPGSAQSLPLDMRILATTSINLQQAVTAGKFMADLFKLIRVIYIQIAPLRDRRQDILPTVRQILRKKIGEGKPLPVLAPEVLGIFEKYSWPGNAGEIESVLEQAIKSATAGKITKSNLPLEIVKPEI